MIQSFGCICCYVPGRHRFNCFKCFSYAIFATINLLRSNFILAHTVEMNILEPQARDKNKWGENCNWQHNIHTGAKNEQRGMISSRSIGKAPSESGGMNTFFTIGIGPWTSYNPILLLNVKSPNNDPGERAAWDQKVSVYSIYSFMKIPSIMHSTNISMVNIWQLTFQSCL